MRLSAAVFCCSGARVNFFSLSKLSLTQSWMSSFIGATPPPQKIDQGARHGAAAAWIDEKITWCKGLLQQCGAAIVGGP